MAQRIVWSRCPCWTPQGRPLRQRARSVQIQVNDSLELCWMPLCRYAQQRRIRDNLRMIQGIAKLAVVLPEEPSLAAPEDRDDAWPCLRCGILDTNPCLGLSGSERGVFRELRRPRELVIVGWQWSTSRVGGKDPNGLTAPDERCMGARIHHRSRHMHFGAAHGSAPRRQPSPPHPSHARCHNAPKGSGEG